MLDLTYLVPLKMPDGEPMDELATYLRGLALHVAEVLVVDGSSADSRAQHEEAVGAGVRVLAPKTVTPMGKVGGVLTGIEEARHERVVIADDDVRYRLDQLRDVADRLEGATVVRPQNHFDPLPWYAWVDTARTLLARAGGGDWPGTLAVRRSAVLAAGGYAGDVMFENLELVRTLVAWGGREHVALDVIVRRVPPTLRHARSQQIRQAYDELARPAHLLWSLAVAPAVFVLRRRPRVLALGAAMASAVAEAGRRRANGRSAYPASPVLVAGPWLLWRSACTWLALGALARGGVPYQGHRLRRAASSMRSLRRAAAQRAG